MPAPAGRYDAVYLAPHLDDVVLSCGGQIARRTAAGQRVLVVTVFAGDDINPSPFARRLHWLYGIRTGVIAHRRREDFAACAVIGAEVMHWDEAEAIYRRDPILRTPLYPGQGTLFGAPRGADAPLIARLVLRLAALPRAAELIAPLAVGGHVDHQLLRLAAERSGERLAYYEDFPYAARREALARALGDPAAWRSDVVALEERHLERRLAAVSEYRSQIRMLFLTHGWMRRAIRRYVRQRGGECLWRTSGRRDRP